MKTKATKLCNKKFNSMVWATTFAISMATLLSMSDRVLAGLMLGKEAISAVNLVCPAYMFGTFVAGLISIGGGFLFSKALGAFDEEKANKIFGVSLNYSFIFGAVIGALMLIFRRQYFEVLGVSEEIIELASKYYYWIVAVNVLYPVRMVLSEFVTSEGDEFITSVSYIAQLIGNFVLSIILCKTIGISGIAMGTLIGTVIAIVINCLHFFRKGNNIHYKFCMKFKLLLDVMKGSLADSILYLLMAITDYFLNYHVVVEFGEYYLPVLSVATVIVHLTIIFDGIGTGFAPLINVYLGEKNYKNCADLMNHVIKFAITEGVAVMILFIAAAKPIVMLFGDLDGELFTEAVAAVRISSLIMPAAAILITVISLYNISGHEYATSLIECFEQTIFVIFFAVVGSSYLGLNGIWLGYVVAFYAVIGVCVWLLPRKWGKDKFPWFLPDDECYMQTFDVVLNQDNIMELKDKIEAILDEKEINMKTSMRIQLIIEELGMSIIDKNEGKELLSEWTISIDKGVKLVIRYEGEVIDLTSDQGENDTIRAMVLSNLMADQENKKFLMSTGFNRCALYFE